MRIFNADGSEEEMCGNGLRCVTKFVVDKGIFSENPLNVETIAGVLTVSWVSESKEKPDVTSVRVDMGKPRLKMHEIPAIVPGVEDKDSRIIGFTRVSPQIPKGLIYPGMSLVSMGNPHVVFLCEDPKKLNLDEIGPPIENDPMFPNRVNAHFCKFNDAGDVCDLRTWERGSGITLACGTGGAAACVAGVLLGIGQRKMSVNFTGGTIYYEWPSDDSSVIMTGPAAHVYDGVIKLNNPKFFNS